MIPCGIFETRITEFFGENFDSICYVIIFGLQHHKIWRFYIQK